MTNENLAAAFESFKFKIGDLVTLKADRRVTAMVIERNLTESPEGIGKCYHVRGYTQEGPLYEMEIDGPLMPTASGGLKHHSRDDIS